MTKIRLILADDHYNVLTQMRTRILRESDLEIVGEAANSMQVIKFAMTANPQVILIDPMMRDGKGVEAIQQICKKLPGIAIVVLTAFVDTILAVELRKLGVRRILAKGIPSNQVIEALREAVSPESPLQSVQ